MSDPAPRAAPAKRFSGIVYLDVRSPYVSVVRAVASASNMGLTTSQDTFFNALQRLLTKRSANNTFDGKFYYLISSNDPSVPGVIKDRLSALLAQTDIDVGAGLAARAIQQQKEQ